MVKAEREEYERSCLSREALKKNPIDQLRQWWLDAINASVRASDAVSLATVDEAGHPDSRIVLLKGFDEEGLVFFTNYNSAKAIQLERHPYASLTIFWPQLERQVRVRGFVQRCAREESERYFKTRPRGSQIAAWASPQSNTLASREELLLAYEAAKERFLAEADVPCPEHWGGYRVIPNSFEFWQGRKDRLHDRFLYTLSEDVWKISRLAP
jgi:pyridoxamine 5'-phosphate oxidase